MSRFTVETLKRRRRNLYGGAALSALGVAVLVLALLGVAPGGLITCIVIAGLCAKGVVMLDDARRL